MCVNSGDGESNPGARKQRLLSLEGALNVRELGGYPVAGGRGGRRVKWGLLYRAAELGGLSEGDKKRLEGRNIKVLVDFRSEEEKNRSPEGSFATVIRAVELPIDAGNLMGVSSSELWVFSSTVEKAVRDMVKLYGALPREAIPRYRELFALLAESSNTPLLYHCTAGKDRTGLASALILHALGADRKTIMKDYLESAEYLRPTYASHIEDKPHMVPYMSVREEYLLTALEVIEESYGGLDRYLSRELKANTGRLRKLYTE
ncbi:MAG: tyrosine-protein phosphatase [Treponema sp.]|nr:tyrosine-protein phosphatase [Treponema sp.]